jgi:hypothetical protein
MLGTIDPIATIALIISAGALALEVRRWFESGPKLILNVMSDAGVIGGIDEDNRPKFALTVTNRGSMPTVITHMILFGYKNWLSKIRGKPFFTAIIPNPAPTHPIPFHLDSNKYWIGVGYYRGDKKEIQEMRAKGQLYCGVICTHSSKEYLIKLQPKKEVQKIDETDY